MRESTEKALRWFLRRKLNQEKFALGETIHCSLKASEAELALAQAMLQEVKDRLIWTKKKSLTKIDSLV